MSAGEQIVEQRNATYGDPLPNLEKIATMWSAHLGVPVSKHDVCLMMVLLKVSREGTVHLDDNLDDIEGYVAISRRTVQVNPRTVG